jgi:predicted adenylyl cyclase CyaB
MSYRIFTGGFYYRAAADRNSGTMPRNVEIKARLIDLEKMREKAAQIADGPATVLNQEDIFFTSPRGRLKLRIQNGTAELIYYFRENTTGPRESDYLCLPVPDPIAARRMLGMVHGERGVVRKTRWLYMVGQTRVHLDRVDGLGDFLELEVVLREKQPIEEGAAIARELMGRLGIRVQDLLDRAYLDLME